MKKIIALLLSAALLIAVAAIPGSAAAKDEAVLRFKDDGTFRIMQFTDTQDGPALKSATAMFLRDSIEEYEPDLIVLTGDNISGGSCTTVTLTEIAIARFMTIFEEYGAPVAAVFGNHDSECLANREMQMEMYEKYDCFVGYADEDLTGCGTYNLPILSSDGSKVAYNIWMFDSLTYNEESDAVIPGTYPTYPENDLGGYACVHKDQIDWYIETSNELKAENGGEPVPSLLFQHIVVPEIYDALEKDASGKWILPEGAKGVMNEDPCPPQYTNGQFDAAVAQGDVKAMFFGHDHKNTYEVNHKGIDLVNTPGSGFGSYGDENRGVRIIDLNENDLSTYETELVTWRDFYDADNTPKYDYLYTYSGNEFEFTEQVVAFFKYVFEVLKENFVIC